MINVEQKIQEILQTTQAEPQRIDARKSKRLDYRRRNIRRLSKEAMYMKRMDRRSFRNKNRRLAHDATTLKYEELDYLVDPVHKKTSGWLTW